MQGKLIAGLIFALLVALFSIQNSVSVPLSFFIWQFETSMVVVVLGSVALGALIMGLFSSVKQIRLKRELRKNESERERLAREREELAELVEELNGPRESESQAESRDNNKQ